MINLVTVQYRKSKILKNKITNHTQTVDGKEFVTIM